MSEMKTVRPRIASPNFDMAPLLHRQLGVRSVGVRSVGVRSVRPGEVGVGVRGVCGVGRIWE